MKQFILYLIRLYQKYLSLDTGLARWLFLTERTCRFEPRCSQYTYEIINKYGILRGGYLGLKRILKCHPWNSGGYDPVS